MITLKNAELTVTVSELGAEIKSVLCGGVEYMWNGRPEVWGNTAPLMFPICGGLKKDTFTFEGKSYQLSKHGYMRTTLFEVEAAENTRAVFCHRSNDETKKVYPFDYELRVIYTLEGRAVKQVCEVKNLSGKTMYFNIGSHEAYYTPEGIEDYDVIFPEEETLFANVLYGNLLSDQRLPILKESCVLPLYDKYFTVDALVFKQVRSRSATLRNRKTGRAVRVDFPDAPYLLLWHKPAAPYICIEPWNGIPDVVNSSFELTEKEGITALEADKRFTYAHTITLL